MITLNKTSEMTAVTATAETEIARYEITYQHGNNRLSILNAGITEKLDSGVSGQQIGNVSLSESGYVSSSIRSGETARYVAEVEILISQLRAEIEPGEPV